LPHSCFAQANWICRNAKALTGLAIYYSAFSYSSNPVHMQKRVFFCGERKLAGLPDATGQAIFVAS
jgi:hypothetical protein